MSSDWPMVSVSCYVHEDLLQSLRCRPVPSATIFLFSSFCPVAPGHPGQSPQSPRSVLLFAYFFVLFSIFSTFSVLCCTFSLLFLLYFPFLPYSLQNQKYIFKKSKVQKIFCWHVQFIENIFLLQCLKKKLLRLRFETVR